MTLHFEKPCSIGQTSRHNKMQHRLVIVTCWWRTGGRGCK